MKKILISLSIIGVVAAIAVGATVAYFSDTETSTGNTFTAGTIDLKVDNQDGAGVTRHIFANNIVPAVQWQGAEYDYNWTIKNTGSIPGDVTYTIKNIKNWENGCNNPETEAGDVTCGAGDDQGELGAQSQMKIVFELNSPPYGYSQTIYPINSSKDVPYTPAAYHLNPGESKNVYIRSWLISGPTNNLVQGDQLEFDLEFKLDQDITP